MAPRSPASGKRADPQAIAIIGGGPAGLMVAEELAPHREVHLYEQGRNVGRKFLVAGQGGFNLTNALDGPALAARYSPPGFLDAALASFGSADLRAWLAGLGIETFVGTSGRVFPARGVKPIDVLNAMRDRLHDRGVHFHMEHRFIGFDDEANAIVEHAGGRTVLSGCLTLFALGGASWPVTGSTGAWPELFATLGITASRFQPSNCGVGIAWPAELIAAHAGKPLKNIRISVGDRSVFGEATITEHGLEGNAIYPVVPALRQALNDREPALLYMDLKPDGSAESLLHRIAGKEPRNYAAALNMGRPMFALLKALTTRDQYASPLAFVHALKHLPIPVNALRPLEEAISTVGGIPTHDLSADFSFVKYPRIFALGEMVDWDAPTGGFLLQACFAMGHHAARSILQRSP